MRFEEFMKRKREGRLPRKVLRSGFDKADDWGILLIFVTLALFICESNGWIP